MEKKFRIPVKSTEAYISIFNFIFNLTKVEIQILAAFIDIYSDLSRLSININPFSTEIKKKVAEKLGREDFNTLNNYIKILYEKRAIQKTNIGYEINKILIPVNEDRIVFEII